MDASVVSGLTASPDERPTCKGEAKLISLALRDRVDT